MKLTKLLPHISKVIVAFAMATPLAFAQEANIAAGKNVTTSSVETEWLNGSAAVDENTNTRWASAYADNQWLQIDLGDVYSIQRVLLDWEVAYGRSYEVQVSTDGSSWQSVFATNSSNGGIDDIANLNAKGRYVKLLCKVRGTQWGFSLLEIEIFGELTDGDGGDPDGNLALNKQAFVSSVESASLTGINALDGNTGTRWGSFEGVDNQWIYVDLGQSYPIERVVLNWETAYAAVYDVQVSNDAENWSTIFSTTNGDGGIDDLSNLNSEGRYVRMLGKQRATQWGYSLWELEVYATNDGGDGGDGDLVWEDEFNSIDLNSWTYQVGDVGQGWGNDELQYYTAGDNTFIEYDQQIDKNVLVIEARKENPNNYQCWYGSCMYTSARMMTLGKKEFMYGRIEARIKLPDTPGIWPAFWALGTNMNQVGWPESGEFDIMEHVGLDPTYTWGALHAPGFAGDGTPLTQHFDHGHVVNQHYHVYAVEWDANGFTWYVDDNAFYHVSRDEVEAKGEWVFSHDFYILLNVAVGGSWPGSPNNASVFPQRMYVDYVRVYQ